MPLYDGLDDLVDLAGTPEPFQRLKCRPHQLKLIRDRDFAHSIDCRRSGRPPGAGGAPVGV